MLLGVRSIVPFQPHHLDSVRSLYREYKALKKQSPELKRAASTGQSD
jgi:hypothetical protein